MNSTAISIQPEDQKLDENILLARIAKLLFSASKKLELSNVKDINLN
jgi:hypothetical protein